MLDGGLAALIVVLALSAVVFREAVFEGRTLSQADLLLQHPPWASVERPTDWKPGNPSLSDATTQFLPWQLFLRERLQAGHLPLWNDRAGAGQPLLANLQSALFSPVTQLAVWLPLRWGLLLGALLKLVVAGAATAVLARRLGASVPASVLAGVAFAFGGFHFLWLAHPHSTVACLLPVLLVVVQRWLSGPTFALRAVFALLVAGLIFGGHIETALHVAIAVGLYALVASSDRPWSARLRLLADLLLWSLLGLSLAAVQLLPFLEYLSVSEAYAQREGHREVWRAVPWSAAPAVAAGVGALLLAAAVWRRAGAERLLTVAAVGLSVAVALTLFRHAGLPDAWQLLVWPDAWGHPVPARELPWSGPRAYVNINNGYAGILPLLLAVFALACARFTPGRRAVTALLALGLVAGYELPLFSELLGRLPLFDLALNYRFTLLVSFGLALLGAFGLDALADAGRRRRPTAAFWGLVLALTAGLALGPRLHAALARDVADAPAPATTPRGDDGVFDEGRAELTPADPIALHGELEAITAPVRDGEPLRVRGWALSAAGPVVVVVVAEQGNLRRALRILPDREPFGELPVDWSHHPAAARAGFVANLDVSDFRSGSFRLKVWLLQPDTPDGALVPLLDQGLNRLRWVPPAPRWWVLWAGALTVCALGSLRQRPAALVLGCALALGVADAGLFARGFHPSAPPERVYPATPATDWLRSRPGNSRLWATRQDVLMPNTASVYGLRDVRTFDALGLDRYARFLKLLRSPGGEDLDLSHPLVALLDLGHVLSPPAWEPPPDAGLVEVLRQPDVVVWRRDRWTARAFVAPYAESLDAYLAVVPESAYGDGVSPAYAARRHAHNVGSALAEEYRHRRRFRDVLAIEGDAPSMQPTRVPVAAEHFAASVMEDWREPRRQEYRVASNAPGWLFVADSYSPGWTVTVNGEPGIIVPAFFAFRAVAVPEGDSRVVFQYSPASFRIGLSITGVALLVLVVILVGGLLRAGRGDSARA